MSSSFHPAVVADSEIPEAYPLIQATCPDVDLDTWKQFASFFVDCPNSGILALRDAANCICGVGAFRLDRDLRAGPILTIHLFTAADLFNSSRIVQVLLDAAETRARDLGCTGLQIRLSENQSKLASRLSALGLLSGAGFFWKKIH